MYFLEYISERSTFHERNYIIIDILEYLEERLVLQSDTITYS